MPAKISGSELSISVKLGGRVYQGDLRAEARVDTDPIGLNQALAEQPGKFAWWAMLEVLARTQAEELEAARATLHAQLYAHYEAALASTDAEGKRAKPTVERIKSKILMEPKYQQAVASLAEANEAHGMLTVARQTMQVRKDSLLAVASNMRAEREGHLRDHLRETRERLRGGRRDIRSRAEYS